MKSSDFPEPEAPNKMNDVPAPTWGVNCVYPAFVTFWNSRLPAAHICPAIFAEALGSPVISKAPDAVVKVGVTVTAPTTYNSRSSKIASPHRIE